jgi:hypothetical protein
LAQIKHWNPQRQSFHNERFLSAVAMKAYTIGPMSADQHKQFGILRGSRSCQLRGGFIKQNENFEKSQELKGRSEKFENQNRFLVRA